MCPRRCGVQSAAFKALRLTQATGKSNGEAVAFEMLGGEVERPGSWAATGCCSFRQRRDRKGRGRSANRPAQHLLEMAFDKVEKLKVINLRLRSCLPLIEHQRGTCE